MNPDTMFGPLDLLLPYVEYVFLVLVLVNAVTRFLAQRHYVDQYQDGGAEALDRYLPHDVSNVLLVLGAFYFTTITLHAGTILSVLALGVFVTDFFEFEARKVEARREDPLQRPKGALAAWTLVLAYALFQSVFVLIEQTAFWSSIV
ncbi:hypothetical protein SAMN06269185_0045 [Natronoarchaeum philippinense]|uniref:DUF7313 domain-containing protein n=1 Tax=Natronoarchaeum philippinense TaxID=558529 RepID=A0A285MZ94_NATPI|nr:hypothetical protein [Natronoarchaeum philippinense]SNZ02530.1 hypothetical protein SAMN06269185_0045 [Natronoarchaeum philippinense]